MSYLEKLNNLTNNVIKSKTNDLLNAYLTNGLTSIEAHDIEKRTIPDIIKFAKHCYAETLNKI